MHLTCNNKSRPMQLGYLVSAIYSQNAMACTPLLPACLSTSRSEPFRWMIRSQLRAFFTCHTTRGDFHSFPFCRWFQYHRDYQEPFTDR